MRLVPHPLREPPHPGMVPERLHRVITSCEVRVSDRYVNVAVAGVAQGDRPIRIA
jgi:hypothetical protein